jgi:hypothetical protein
MKFHNEKGSQTVLLWDEMKEQLGSNGMLRGLLLPA